MAYSVAHGTHAAMPCVIRWSYEQDSFQPPDLLSPLIGASKAYQNWLAARLFDNFDVVGAQQFQCPLYLCDHLSDSTWPAFVHGCKCPQLAQGWYFCSSCRRHENFLTLQSSSPGTSLRLPQATKHVQTNLSHDLRSIGDQFVGTNHSSQLDLLDAPGGNARPQDLIVSTSSYESKQESTRPAIHVAARPRSLHGFGQTQFPDTARKYTRSEGIPSTSAIPRNVSAFSSQYLVGNLENMTTNYASDLVVRLCGLVLTTNRAWMSTLANEPNDLQQVLAYQIPSIFETGLRALQKCVGHSLPTSFVEVFCLAHVSFASACAVHERERESYDWDALAQSLLQWGHIIQMNEEKALYLRVIESVRRARLISPHVYQDMSPNISLVCSRQPLPKVYASPLGKAMRQGIELLDLFEYANILERKIDTKHPYWEPPQIRGNARILIDNILKPLQNIPGQENIHYCARTVQEKLNEGILFHPRDAEIDLLQESKRSFGDYRQRDSFVHDVVTRFDKVMNGSRWREPYHALNIIQILAIAHERNKDRRKSWTSREPCPDLLSSRQTTTSTQVSPIFDSPQRPHIQQSTTSLASFTEMSRSVSGASVVDHTELTTDCPYHECPVTFTGNSLDRKSNCKRHIKTKHLEPRPYLCPQHGCNKEYTSEWNVTRHIKSEHPGLT